MSFWKSFSGKTPEFAPLLHRNEDYQNHYLTDKELRKILDCMVDEPQFVSDVLARRVVAQLLQQLLHESA